MMMTSKIYRASGMASLAGAMLFAAHIVLRSVITAGLDTYASAQHELWTPVNLLGVAGAVLVLLGLPAMYARMAALSGTAGLIGVSLLAIAWMFIGLFLSLFSVLVAPWLADGAPALTGGSASLPGAFVIAFGIGLVAWFAGNILLGIPFIRKRVQPAWAGYALVASGVWILIGNLVIAPGGPAPNLAVNLLSNLAPLLLLVVVAYLGYRMSVGHEEYAGR